MKERGSILLLVLFVCIGIAVLVQTLTVVVLCADRVLATEDSGRRLTEEKDQALETLRHTALIAWTPLPWSPLPASPQDVKARLDTVAGSDGWVLDATARHAEEVSPVVVSAWVERGRDGLDLPLAGLVAQTASCPAGRLSPCLQSDGDAAGEADAGGRPVAWLKTAPPAPVLAPGIATATLDRPWALDEGWRTFIRGSISGQEAEQGLNDAEGIGLCADVCLLSGASGRTVRLAEDWGADLGRPGLAVVFGGATIDASSLGERWGVILADAGGVTLDGTFLHGAIFAGETVDFGETGVLAFSPKILRWATDRSLVRTRLVPGSRRESLE